MPNHLLSQREAAAYCGLSPRTLERARVTGEGPPYAKLGRRVLYRRPDLDEWISSRIRQNTSEHSAEQRVRIVG
jgi:excisionase family DNA binding protein